jgi:hypothetical protein
VAKFLLLLEGLAAQPSAPDEQTRAYNRRWVDWIGSLVQGGVLESGSPLTATAKQVTKDSASDYPLRARDIYGYLVLNAESLDEVVDIVRRAPHTELGGKTIIRPCHDQAMT